MTWEPNAIDASVAATVAALLGVLVTNQAKVSEFRQKWIDALRDDVALLITHSFIIHTGELSVDNPQESYLQINQSSARIRLRLNPKEKRTHAVIASMNKLREASEGRVKFEDMKGCVNEFVAAVQKVLKKEWRRVKWGEPLYRSIFVLAIVAVLLSLLAFMHQNFGWHIPFIPGLI